MNRAYSLLTIKSIDEEARIIEGIASTPTPDRMGDIVDPKGAQFTLPLPLLYQHNSKQPIGHVIAAKVTDAGIEIKAQVAPGVVPFIDEAWALIKAGLVRGLSIGFSSIEAAQIKDTFSFHFLKWDWLELSAVTIPANAEANIQTIKSLDSQQRAASGASAVEPMPGATGPTKAGKSGPVTLKGNKMKPIAEQIAGFEAKRAALVASNDAIMTKVADEGRTLDETEKQTYDGAASEVKTIDEHLVRLREHEKSIIAKAVPITPANAGTPEDASKTRGGNVILMGGNNLPKGTAFTRYAMALAASRGNLMQAAELAKGWKDSTPEVEVVLKAAVAAGTTASATWAGPLTVAQNMASEFIDLLRPETIIGRIPGLRRVPFNISMARTTAGSTSQWVGEGLPKPISAMAFETITLGHTKIATIVVLTEETVRFSNPAAEAIVSADMRAAIAQYSDAQFIDPTVTASANLRPASITNGATSFSMTAATIAGITTDVALLFGAFSTANLNLSSSVFVMHPRTAMFLSMLRTTQDVFAFPGISMTGGTFFGLPVVTSNSVPIESGDVTSIFLINAAEIMIADDGDVTLDVSREASLQMDSSPTNPVTSSVSLWQSNLVGLRAERFINYRRRRDAAVAYLSGVTY
jgi:HK97 family phage major capsid protein/HK97 family phage prohead protease